MELPASGYLYTLALLAMTFVGFTAIVMIVRQSLGNSLSRYDALAARFFMVWGFVIAYSAMMPPLLAMFDVRHAVIWGASSAVGGLLLLSLSLSYPILRSRATGGRAPSFVRYQSTAGVAIERYCSRAPRSRFRRCRRPPSTPRC
jgi:hypothetical protein